MEFEVLKESYQKGKTFLIDKPLEWTAFDVVNKLRYTLKKQLKLPKIKVGHAGTLDPLATGLLIVCVGKHTKGIDRIQGQVKEYTGEFYVGATTPSYDLESEVDKEFDIQHLNQSALLEAAQKLTGTIQQRPPLFSAKKIDGKRAYLHAREGCLLYTSPSPRDRTRSRMPSSA